jgi:RNA polymerase sigma-70 factor, ECF subfamily
LILAPSPPR